jgi:leucyl aminopeptidase
MASTLRVSADLTGPLSESDVVVVPVVKVDESFSIAAGVESALAELDCAADIDAEYAKRQGFDAKGGELLILRQHQDGPVILGAGCGDGSDLESWRLAAAAVARRAKGSRAVLLLPPNGAFDVVAVGEAVATGALLGSYSFSVRSTEPKPSLKDLDVVTMVDGKVGTTSALSEGVTHGVSIGGAVGFARDLVNDFPSSMTPEALADAAIQRLSSSTRVDSDVWGLERIATERLGGLVGVNKGSTLEPRFVVATYMPEGNPSKHVILVGKGITFDSGGLSLKPANGMMTMKTDMTGAAVVLSALSACQSLGINAKVTAIAPMTENMPSGSAVKPGDVLTARNGVTMEVLNTDAEGRLVLADGLSYAVEQDPDVIIDVATLTGAAVVALGSEVGVFFANNEELAEGLDTSGNASGEPWWRLPLYEPYNAHIKSEIADIKNIGASGEAGTISAALFLQRFVGDVPWAHLDIAGPSRSDKERGLYPVGGTAFGLRTILEYLRSL